MNKINTFTLSRRKFASGIGAITFSFCLPNMTFSEMTAVERADALIQLRIDGKLVIYSGAGHIGPYNNENIVAQIVKYSGIPAKNIIFALSGNPSQLPAILGQHSHHMSFTSIKTIKKALKTLVKAQADNLVMQKGAKYVIEDGVSKATYKLAGSLVPEGIIVAASQVSV
ncbi:MAG: hypothetical protein H6912_00595 [Kordiimonadaceae bacterium]|nr:hypothetical protein [Kordiimonadaceae bacterium]